MRIAFITGELEPNCNGVGDYTRRLAAACAVLGHPTCLLSLAERSVQEPMEESQSCDGIALPVLRMGLEAWRQNRGQRARDWLHAFRPDWVSLQFVPYSFHPRGFFGPVVAQLAETLGGLRRHVFFHEIWIGSYVGAPLKERLFGWWQRIAMRRLLRVLRPCVIHTSNEYYCEALSELEQKVGILTMFGCVPAIAESEPGPDALTGAVVHDALVCGMFGSLHPDWAVEPLLGDFVKLAASLGRPAALVSVGALGPGEAMFDRLAEHWRSQIAFVKFGRCETAQIARIFRRFDFGVTSVPWNILGKSSSVAALREHGLTVVVTNAGAPARCSRNGGVIDEVDGCLPYFRDRAQLRKTLDKVPRKSGVRAVVSRFLADLSAMEQSTPSRNQRIAMRSGSQ